MPVASQQGQALMLAPSRPLPSHRRVGCQGHTGGNSCSRLRHSLSWHLLLSCCRSHVCRVGRCSFGVSALGKGGLCSLVSSRWGLGGS